MSIEGDVPDLDRSITFAKKLPTALEMESIPLQDLSNLAEQIDVSTREVATNNNLDMQEFLGIDRALTRFNGEIANKLAKLSKLDKQLAHDWEKLEEIKDDPSYSKELKASIQERIDNAEIKQRGRIQAVSINEDKLRSQFSRITETIAKILDSNTSLSEKLRTLFREQRITLAAIFTAIVMIISTIVVSITRGSVGGAALPKDKNKLVEWFKDKLKCLFDALRRLAGKAVEAFPGTFLSVFGEILNFLAKAAGFAATNAWAFLVFVVGAVVTWVYTQTT